MAFVRSKSEKKHTREVIEYEKCLVIKKSLQTLLQVMKELYLIALKERVHWIWWQSTLQINSTSPNKN